MIAFEAQRDAAYFESPEARLRSSRFRLLNADFMTATTGIHLLHQTIERLRRRQRGTTLARLQPLHEALAATLLLARLAAFRDRLPMLIDEARSGLADAEPIDRLDLDCAADLQFSARL